ncbi:MAG: 50S ribosomal protein L23 [Verrucomicrobia bacterium]|nr:50S ribosomal protein L23 [Verrucomicrobiota bacterium]MDA1085745.1 50S ribosomal protein L23 [Verrucomicrobiota bacterium]
MKKNPYGIVRNIQMTEKGSAMLAQNKYLFEVARDANRVEIKGAVELLFKVDVTKVNTMNYRGKMKRDRTQRGFGKRADWKRAVVTLAEGQEIPLG